MNETWQYVRKINSETAHNGVFYASSPKDTLAMLKTIFPKGEANEMNFVLFSTSGVHGSYGTIEEAEADEEHREVTSFLYIRPRIVCVVFGNVALGDADDIAFLKRLRQSSWDVVQKIGADRRPLSRSKKAGSNTSWRTCCASSFWNTPESSRSMCTASRSAPPSSSSTRRRCSPRSSAAPASLTARRAR